MKNLFSLLLITIFTMAATCITPDVAAQTNVKKLVVQSANAVNDTISFNRVVSKINAFQVTVEKETGTVAGKIYFEASLDGIGWQPIDTLTLADAAINTKVYPMLRSAGTPYLNYRFRCVPTGTQTSTVTATYIRRTDE